MSDSDNIVSRPMSFPVLRWYWLTFILLLPFCPFALGNTDSLVVALGRVKSDRSKVEIMYSISDNLAYSNQSEGLRYGKQALDLAHSIRWDSGLFFANTSVGTNYQNSGVVDSARIYFKNALEVAERLHNKVLMANAYN